MQVIKFNLPVSLFIAKDLALILLVGHDDLLKDPQYVYLLS